MVKKQKLTKKSKVDEDDMLSFLEELVDDLDSVATPYAGHEEYFDAARDAMRDVIYAVQRGKKLTRCDLKRMSDEAGLNNEYTEDETLEDC
jgi:hypothetical protein